MEYLEQFGLVFLVAWIFALDVDVVEQHQGQVAARATLAGAKEEESAIVEDVARGGVVLGFEIAGSNDPQLLVGFVEVALGDPRRGVSVSG
jgi:hypothetical protein